MGRQRPRLADHAGVRFGITAAAVLLGLVAATSDACTSAPDSPRVADCVPGTCPGTAGLAPVIPGSGQFAPGASTVSGTTGATTTTTGVVSDGGAAAAIAAGELAGGTGSAIAAGTVAPDGGATATATGAALGAATSGSVVAGGTGAIMPGVPASAAACPATVPTQGTPCDPTIFVLGCSYGVLTCFCAGTWLCE